MIQHFLLGILATQPLYGYQIKKICDAHFSQLRPMNYGSIYPNLRKLKERGLLIQKVDPQDNRPNRKVYTITEKGRREFQKWLHQPAVRQPVIQDEFTLKFLFSHEMDKQEALELIDRQVELIRSWRTDGEKKGKYAASGYASNAYARMLGELFDEIHKATLRWLVRCRRQVVEMSDKRASIPASPSREAAESVKRMGMGRE